MSITHIASIPSPVDSAFFTITVSPDGSKLVAGDMDGNIVIYAVGADGKFTHEKTLPAGDENHKKGRRVVAIAVSPDMQKIVSLDTDGGKIEWNPASDFSQVSRAIPDDPASASAFVAAFSPLKGTPLCWAASIAGQGFVTNGARSENMQEVVSIAACPAGDAPVWAVGNKRGELMIATVDERGLLSSIPGLPILQVVEEDGLIDSVAFSPDGTLLAVSTSVGQKIFRFDGKTLVELEAAAIKTGSSAMLMHWLSNSLLAVCEYNDEVVSLFNVQKAPGASTLICKSKPTDGLYMGGAQGNRVYLCNEGGSKHIAAYEISAAAAAGAAAADGEKFE